MTRDRYSIISDGLPSQLPDIDPGRDPGVDRLLRRAPSTHDGRQRARFLMLQAARARPRAPGRRAGAAQHRLHQHASRPSASRGSRATRTSSAGSGPTSAGTPRSWSAGPTAPGGVGGHIATYASAASLYEVGFNHFFRGKDHGRRHGRPDLLPGPRRAGHLRPRLPGGPAHRAAPRRLPAGDVARPDGLSSYPHPRLMPDFWEFPTVSMGLGPIGAIYQARFNRYLDARGIADTSQQPRLGLPRRRRDGRARVARRDRRRRPRGAGQPHLRHQLQPAAPRRPGARQRQDHPGAGVLLPRRRLERHQGDLGPRLGPAAGRRTATACWSTR